MKFWRCWTLPLLTAFVLQGTTALSQSRTTDSRAGTVTILSEITGSGSAAQSRSQALLADAIFANNGVRVLSVEGRGGGVEIVKDLLYQRGIDFAIINSDVLSYLELRKELGDPRRRLRYVAELSAQKIYLIARKDIAALPQLAGRRVAVIGEKSASYVTATTLLGLSAVAATITTLPTNAVIDESVLKQADAFILVGADIEHFRPATSAHDFRLVDIRRSPAVAETYKRISVEAGEIPTLASGRIETLSVSQILATFDWATSHARYPEVNRFIGGFFLTLLDLRRQAEPNLWRHVSIAASVPGWTRSRLAQPERVLPLATYADLVEPLPSAAISQTPAISTKVTDNTAAPAAPPVERNIPTIKVFAVNRPPMAGDKLLNRGLAIDLLERSLKETLGSATTLYVSWLTEEAMLQAFVDSHAPEVFLPWEAADCDRVNSLRRAMAMACDAGLFSEPILQVVVGVFAQTAAPVRFRHLADLRGKTLCVVHDGETNYGIEREYAAFTQFSIAIISRRTTIECAAAVQLGDADAFVALDLEGQYTLRQYGLETLFAMIEEPLAIRAISAVVAKSGPNAVELIGKINTGLAKLKSGDLFANTVGAHVLVDRKAEP